MTDNNVIKLAQPETFIDSLTEILRSGARALLTQAVEAEVADFLHRHSDLKTDAGRRRVVRHGHLPEREIMTGIGPVGVRQPRIRDREAAAGERIRFSLVTFLAMLMVLGLNPRVLQCIAIYVKRFLCFLFGNPCSYSVTAAISEVVPVLPSKLKTCFSVDGIDCD